MSGRAHSAAHSSRPGNSVRGLCAGVDAVIPSGGSVNKSLHQLQNYMRNHNPIRINEWLNERNCASYIKIQYKKNGSLKEIRARGKKKQINKNIPFNISKNPYFYKRQCGRCALQQTPWLLLCSLSRLVAWASTTRCIGLTHSFLWHS